jgi:integrase
VTFEKLFTDYMKSPQFCRLADKSKQMYIYSGEQMGNYLKDKPIREIRRSDLLRFQNNNSARPAFANAALRVASVVFSHALDMDMIDHNPAARMRKLKIGSHEKWTPNEVRSVIALRDRRISTAVALAWYTGQREGDILSMQWKDFDGQYIAVVQSKTKLEMKIRAHPDLIAYLESIRKGSCPTDFIVSGKQIFNSSAFRGMLKRRLDDMGIHKVFHGIRKGVASSLAENRAPISEIAAMMGHKSMRMAAYYAEQASSKTLTDNAVSSLVSCID